MLKAVQWNVIIIIIVVVVVDDDTYYWVYLSSDHPFQVYYKVQQVSLQSATAYFVAKCDGLSLLSARAFLLQSATKHNTTPLGLLLGKQNIQTKEVY